MYCQQAVSVCETRLERLRNESAMSNGKGKSVVGDDADAKSQKSLEEHNHVTPAETETHTSKKEADEIKEIEQLLEDLKEKVRNWFSLLNYVDIYLRTNLTAELC